MSAAVEKKRLIFLIGLLGPLTTLIVSPWTNLDPINPIKLLAVSTIAGGCLGIVLGMTSAISEVYSKSKIYSIMHFPLISLVAFLVSDSNKVQQFFGVYGRNTGLLNYLVLFVVLFASSLVDTDQLGHRVHFGLKVTSSAMLIYCLIQIAGLDPIGWSSFAPFGTLGNINFASAFLGLSAVSIGVYSLSKKMALSSKLLLGLHQAVTLFVIEKTGSIQGLLVFFLGYWVAITIWLYISKGALIFVNWIALSVIAFAFAVVGFLNRGPLATILYQETNTFRFDYWHAGIKMIESAPVFGHGFESYGDLYTQDRGLISALRTSLGRTSNSAHNIFIDVGVNGGLSLLLALMVIFGLALLNSIRYLRLLKSANENDFMFVGLFSFWVAYMAQALISINQIGVGVWAWIITGIMLGITRVRVSAKNNLNEEGFSNFKKAKRTSSNANKNMGPLSAIFGLVFTTLSFSAGYVPVSADAAFRSGSDNRSLNEMIDASNAFGASSYIISKTVDVALQSNYPDQALQLTETLIREYPLDSYAWKIRAKLANVSESERLRALNMILELDPFFACATPAPIDNFKRWLFALPPDKQFELANWWRLSEGFENTPSFRLSQIDQEALNAKLLSLC